MKSVKACRSDLMNGGIVVTEDRPGLFTERDFVNNEIGPAVRPLEKGPQIFIIGDPV